MSVVILMCCQVEVSVSGWSLIQRCLTDCGVSECDREVSTMRRPCPTRGSCVMEQNAHYPVSPGFVSNSVNLDLFHDAPVSLFFFFFSNINAKLRSGTYMRTFTSTSHNYWVLSDIKVLCSVLDWSNIATPRVTHIHTLPDVQDRIVSRHNFHPLYRTSRCSHPPCFLLSHIKRRFSRETSWNLLDTWRWTSVSIMYKL